MASKSSASLAASKWLPAWYISAGMASSPVLYHLIDRQLPFALQSNWDMVSKAKCNWYFLVNKDLFQAVKGHFNGRRVIKNTFKVISLMLKAFVPVYNKGIAIGTEEHWKTWRLQAIDCSEVDKEFLSVIPVRRRLNFCSFTTERGVLHMPELLWHGLLCIDKTCFSWSHQCTVSCMQAVLLVQEIRLSFLSNPFYPRHWLLHTLCHGKLINHSRYQCSLNSTRDSLLCMFCNSEVLRSFGGFFPWGF